LLQSRKRKDQRLTPAAEAKAADCVGGVVPGVGGAAKEEFLALMALE
jgi:hypothetical protein